MSRWRVWRRLVDLRQLVVRLAAVVVPREYSKVTMRHLQLSEKATAFPRVGVSERPMQQRHPFIDFMLILLRLSCSSGSGWHQES